MIVHLGPVRAPCRVVYVVDEPDRRGFAYGTLPGHAESGEELFLVRYDPATDEVYAEVTAFSRHAHVVEQAGLAGHVADPAAGHRPLSAGAVDAALTRSAARSLDHLADDIRTVTVNEPSGVEATHLRIAELVQELYGRPDTDSDTVVAELAEHAAVEIPGRPVRRHHPHPRRQAHRDAGRDPSCGRCCWTRSSNATVRARA